LPDDKFPVLSDHARRMAILYDITYILKQLFSEMKVDKKKSRNLLDSDDLENTS
jgi:hypothetical protein